MNELKELITKIIKSKEMDDRIISFTDLKNKYVNLKPAVKVTVELTDGKSYVIDVTDYFEGVVK